MRNIVAFLGFLLLGACFTPAVVQHAAPDSPSARVVFNKYAGPVSGVMAKLDAQGEQALELLKQWYDNDVANCGGTTRPAHLCSGVMIRGTSTSYAYFPWDPSPGAIALGGTSASWFRRDQTFSDIYGSNGLLFYPGDSVPEGRFALDVLCTFPREGTTFSRPTLQGCGPFPEHESTTSPCADLGILTAEQWLAHYSMFGLVCGWNLRPEAGATSQWFTESLKAHQQGPEDLWTGFNELMVKTWEPGQGGALPIVGFFYNGRPGEALKGKTLAVIDQIRYYNEYRQLLPVIRVDAPAAREEPVTFTYSGADQGFAPLRPNVPADFEDVPTGISEFVMSQGLEIYLGTGSSGVRDEPLASSLIKGHYAAKSLGSALGFGIRNHGPVRLTFDWGCEGRCSLREIMSGKRHVLTDEIPERMQFGTFTTTIEAPEFIDVIGVGAVGLIFVIDNIRIEPLTQSSLRRAP